jgi:hypothetical protein
VAAQHRHPHGFLDQQGHLPDQDEGIDIIAETKEGHFWAVQAKYRSDPNETLTLGGKGSLATFSNLAFRYCKNINLPKKVLFNDKEMNLVNSNGLITFEETQLELSKKMKDYFNIYVGLVSGKEEVYKNEELGNIDVLNGEDKIDRYIFIKEFPTDNDELNKEYDFVSKGKQVASAAAVLSDTAIEKIDELNAKVFKYYKSKSYIYHI